MNDLVSVIIPYFNRPEKLQRCIQSVQSQSYQPVEIIVVNDCSTLPPHPLDDDIIYIKNLKNLGPGPSRNRGMKVATGQYLAFLDCDDYWAPEFLREMVQLLMSNTELIMAYANGLKVDANGNELGLRKKRIVLSNSIIPDILKLGRPWGTGGCVWVADKIKDVQWLDAITWEDYAFDIDAALFGNSIIGSAKVLVYYDSEGEDKLSNQNTQQTPKRKQLMLLYISEKLSNSDWILDPETRKAMQLQLLYQLIALQNFGIATAADNKRLVHAFIIWKNKRMAYYVAMLLLVPMPWRIRLLRNYRKHIKQQA